MKKIRPAILAMLLLVMVLSVTACGSSNNETQAHDRYQPVFLISSHLYHWGRERYVRFCRDQ